jgi:hypothetical protein
VGVAGRPQPQLYVLPVGSWFDQEIYPQICV